jgi:hypothetical protein
MVLRLLALSTLLFACADAADDGPTGLPRSGLHEDTGVLRDLGTVNVDAGAADLGGTHDACVPEFCL